MIDETIQPETIEPPTPETAPPVTESTVPATTEAPDIVPDTTTTAPDVVVPPDVVEGGVELLLPILGEIKTSLTELQEEPRPFLTTPLAEFTVTEGMLLLIAVLLLLGFLCNMIKEAF